MILKKQVPPYLYSIILHQKMNYQYMRNLFSFLAFQLLPFFTSVYLVGVVLNGWRERSAGKMDSDDDDFVVSRRKSTRRRTASVKQVVLEEPGSSDGKHPAPSPSDSDS